MRASGWESISPKAAKFFGGAASSGYGVWRNMLCLCPLCRTAFTSVLTSPQSSARFPRFAFPSQHHLFDTMQQPGKMHRWPAFLSPEQRRIGAAIGVAPSGCPFPCGAIQFQQVCAQAIRILEPKQFRLEHHFPQQAAAVLRLRQTLPRGVKQFRVVPRVSVSSMVELIRNRCDAASDRLRSSGGC